MNLGFLKITLVSLNRPTIPSLILKHWVPSRVENGIKWVNRKTGVHVDPSEHKLLLGSEFLPGSEHIHANQNFHVAKKCQKIIGSRESQLVPAGGFQEKRAVKFFFGYIDFSTSIHFISDIASSESWGFFNSARQVKLIIGHWLLDSISSLLDRLLAR